MATGDRNSDTAVYDALCDGASAPEARCSCGWRGDADSADEHECGQKPLSHTELQPIPIIPTEPAIVRIAKALVALAATIHDTALVSIFPSSFPSSVTIACKTDEGVRALAASAGLTLREVSNATHRWLTSSGTGDALAVYGPHHEIVEPPAIDETAVAAALAQAEVAL